MKAPVGIVGYGAYIPRYRIKTSEIARAWGWEAEAYRKGLGMEEKSVAARDQDCITLAVEAARRAIRRGAMDPAKIGAIYIGSESHPYAVKPSGTVVSEALGTDPLAPHRRPGVRLQGGHRGDVPLRAPGRGRARSECALAIGSDTAQGAPGDPLEFATAAGAAAFIFGREGVAATMDASVSYMTDTPDFWRREEERFPRHGGRFTGEPGYFHHTLTAARKLLEQTGLKAGDFAHAVFHQPNGKFPVARGTDARVLEGAMPRGAVCRRASATCTAARRRSGSAPCSTRRSPGQKIFMVSYGSGAGSDGFVFTVTGPDRRGPRPRRRPSRRSCRSRPCSSTTRATRGSAARSRAKRIDRRFRYRNEERRTMRDVAIIGVGMTRFGELWEKSLRDSDGRGGARGDRRRGRGPRGLDVRRLHVERPVRRAGAPGEPGLRTSWAWGRSRRRASNRPAPRAGWRSGRRSSRSPAA